VVGFYGWLPHLESHKPENRPSSDQAEGDVADPPRWSGTVLAVPRSGSGLVYLAFTRVATHDRSEAPEGQWERGNRSDGRWADGGHVRVLSCGPL
jgi:hypothetical protein